jgi:hypothetical protein
MMQNPPLPADWANSIPAWLIGFSFLIGVMVWAAKQLGFVKPTNGNGKQPHEDHNRIRTFAEDQDRYWREMNSTVTEPLASGLRDINRVLTELRDRAILEEGRQQARAEAARAGDRRRT